MNKIILLSFLFFITLYSSQSVNDFHIPDSLKNKTFEHLEKYYGKEFRVAKKSLLYANTFLVKAKREKNITKQIDGYFLIFTQSKKNVLYVDSIKNIINKNNNINNLSYGYYKMGHMYYNSAKYDYALSSYLQALTYAKANGDKKRIALIKNAIGDIKSRTYDYEESLKIFKENYNYFKKEEKKDPNNYLSVLYSLTVAYNGVGKYDSAYIYANLGRSKCLVYNKKYYYRVFDLACHIIEFHLKDNQQSIYGLKKNMDYFKKYDSTNLGITYMYLSMNFEKLNNRPEYFYYFNKMDSIQKRIKFIRPELIGLYQNSLKFYEKTGNKKKQIYLIDRLIMLNDTIYKSNYEFSKKIHKKFDTPELLEQKQKLISNLNKRNIALYWSLSTGFLILLVFIYLYCINKKKLKTYKIQAQKLIDKQNKSSGIDESDNLEKLYIEDKKVKTPSILRNEKFQKGKSQIPENIRQAIIVKLHDFEKQKMFLNKGITLHSLSKDFETNRDYLSKIINENKGKSFSQYLNELRINYAINELKGNRKLRLKTIASISEDVGFNNVESFTKAFKNVTGTLPSYYIKILQKESN